MFSSHNPASDPAIQERLPQPPYAREVSLYTIANAKSTPPIPQIVPTPPIPPPPPITPFTSRLPPIFPTCYKQACFFYSNEDLGMQKFNLRVMALPDGRTRVQLHPLILTNQKRELNGLCTKVFVVSRVSSHYSKPL